MLDVHRLRRMLELGSVSVAAVAAGAPTAAARFLRPKQQYALNFSQTEVTRETGNDLP
jgi:hypothetical protein